MEQLTIDHVRRYAKSAEARAAARALHKARQDAARLRLAIAALIAPVFARFEFYADTGERITDEKDLYKVADLDTPEMREWDEARDKAIHDAGYNVPHGHCPALIAQGQVRKCEARLLEIGARHFGIVDAEMYGELRERALALFMEPFGL